MNKISKLDAFHLHIAGYCLELNFSKIVELKIKVPLIKNIYYHYTPYLTGACPHKYLYKINFLEIKDIPLLGKKNNTQMDYFIKLFSRKANTLNVHYHLSIDQLQLILKIIVQELLLKSGGFYLHASSVLDGDSLQVFTGPSTAGKSTIVKNLRQAFIPFSDDVIILKPLRGVWTGYQFPLDGDPTIYTFRSPNGFKVIFTAFIHKAEAVKMTIMDKKMVIEQLLKQVSGGTIYKHHITSVFKYGNKVPIYMLDVPLKLSDKKYREYTRSL